MSVLSGRECTHGDRTENGFQLISLLVKALNHGKNLTEGIACLAGVNGEGEGEREKNGVLRARDEGTPATKTPFFHLRPPIFM